jgi:hypothetical protein
LGEIEWIMRRVERFTWVFQCEHSWVGWLYRYRVFIQKATRWSNDKLSRWFDIPRGGNCYGVFNTSDRTANSMPSWCERRRGGSEITEKVRIRDQTERSGAEAKAKAKER